MPTFLIREGEGVRRISVAGGHALTIGRADYNHIILDGDRVSRNHAQVEITPDGNPIISDRGSANGTFVNERLIARPTVLRPTDRVRVGKHALFITVEDELAPATDRSEPITSPGPQPPPLDRNRPIPNSFAHACLSIMRVEDLDRPRLPPVFPPPAPPPPPPPRDLQDDAPLPASDALPTPMHYDRDDPLTPRVMQAVDPVEADFLSTLRTAPEDDETRLVYADWLEENGQNLKAEYLRLQCRLAALFEPDPEMQEVQDRLRSISPASDAWWRALTSRPTIEKCDVRFRFKCPKRWTALEQTTDPAVRHCAACDRHVYFCATLVEVVAHGSNKECVAFDSSLLEAEAHEAYNSNEDSMLMGDIG